MELDKDTGSHEQAAANIFAGQETDMNGFYIYC